MADKRRLNLSFSLTSPQRQEAWRILSSIPAGQRTDAVCRMVCKAHEQDALLSAIRGLDPGGTAPFESDNRKKPAGTDRGHG
ncbi:MAG: hypothetical protein ACLRWQ_15675 [Flavonifractor plautii]